MQAFVNQTEDELRTLEDEYEEVGEDFSTKTHECLAIILQNGKRACGISLFRKGI